VLGKLCQKNTGEITWHHHSLSAPHKLQNGSEFVCHSKTSLFAVEHDAAFEVQFYGAGEDATFDVAACCDLPK
jgi:hypothetical protein